MDHVHPKPKGASEERNRPTQRASTSGRSGDRGAEEELRLLGGSNLSGLDNLRRRAPQDYLVLPRATERRARTASRRDAAASALVTTAPASPKGDLVGGA